jgi:hypothetical protein
VASAAQSPLRCCVRRNLIYLEGKQVWKPDVQPQQELSRAVDD